MQNLKTSDIKARDATPPVPWQHTLGICTQVTKMCQKQGMFSGMLQILSSGPCRSAKLKNILVSSC